MEKDPPFPEKIRIKLGSIVGYGSIFASEIILFIILLIYPQYLFAFYTSKVVGDILIGLLSDAYKRKVVLCFCFVILCVFSFTIFIMELNGHGATDKYLIIPIIGIALLGDASIPGLSSLVDFHPKMNRRKLMANAVKMETIVWMVIGSLSIILSFKPINFIIVGAVLSGALILPALLSKDETHPMEKQLTGIQGFIGEIKKLKKIKPILIATCALILLVEIGFFMFFFRVEEDIHNTLEKSRSILSWSVSMFIGCLWHNSFFADKKERNLIISGLVLTVLGLLIYLLFNKISPNDLKIQYISYGIMGLGSGLFLPCFYSIMSSLRDKHYQGFLIGLVDSMRTLGEWMASFLFQLFITKNPIVFYIFSFGIFVLSTPLFIRYFKYRNSK